MIILAIDTTSEDGSIALVQSSRRADNGADPWPAPAAQLASSLLESVPLHSPDGYAHVLFDAIAALLHRHNLTWRDIEGFAAAAGPGAFTGIRVGLTAVKGLAEATDRKVVAVSNLQALAWFGTGPLRAPILDARRGDVFGAVYNARLELVQPETVQALESFLASLPAGAERIFRRSGGQSGEGSGDPRELARAVAAIAEPVFAAGRAQDPAEIDANYVRHADAELKWKDRT